MDFLSREEAVPLPLSLSLMQRSDEYLTLRLCTLQQRNCGSHDIGDIAIPPLSHNLRGKTLQVRR